MSSTDSIGSITSTNTMPTQPYTTEVLNTYKEALKHSEKIETFKTVLNNLIIPYNKLLEALPPELKETLNISN